MISRLFIFLLCLFTTSHFSNPLSATLYFMHVPKTGGTTLRLLLEQHLTTEEIYPARNHKTANTPMKHELVSGHFPYWFCKKLDENFESNSFKVTILRHPVERFLSFLRAKKQANTEIPDLESVLTIKHAKNMVYFGAEDNTLCRYFSSNPKLEGEALLESAKENLEKIDHVIFFDHFAKDICDLFSRLGIELDESTIPKMNVSMKEPISPELLQKVEDLNQLDMQLYEYAKTHLQKQNTKYSLRTQSFAEISKKTQEVDYTFNLPLNGSGWSYREPLFTKVTKNNAYRWVTDQPAHIYFPLEEGLDYDLYFNANPLTEEIQPRVNINGKEIEIVKLNNDPFSLYHGKIPRNYLMNKATEITFYSAKAFLFKDIYPNKINLNHPLLSFAVNRIQIIQCK